MFVKKKLRGSLLRLKTKSFTKSATYFINVNHTIPVISIASQGVNDLLVNGNDAIEPQGFFEYYEALDKVKLVQVEENIYVNPAWNLGIKIAKNDLIELQLC